MFKHKHPTETRSTRGKKGGNGTLVTMAETPTKPAPDKGSIMQGAKSLDFEELIAHRYESFQHDIHGLIEALEDYYESMGHERKARAKAFEKIELFSKHTPLVKAIRTKPSTSSIYKSYEKTSHEHADLFEDKILDYVKEWKDIVSFKFETEMKEMKEYRDEKTRRKQQVKQLRTHRDKMFSINKEKAESETPKLSHKEDKLDVAVHRYEKHKKILTQIIDELIDGSWKDLYPVMGNLYQLEMDTANKKAEILSGLRASIDKMSKITKEHASSPSSVSSNTTLWRSLRNDWLNSGPVPTVPTPAEPQPLANTLKTSVPTKEDSMESEKRNDEEKIIVYGENAPAEREAMPEVMEQRDSLGEMMKSAAGTKTYVPPGDETTGWQKSQGDDEKPSDAQNVTLIDRQAAFPDTETTSMEEDRPDESQDKQSGLMSTLLPPYFKGEANKSDDVPNEQTGDFQDAQPGDKQPGLVGSVLAPFYKGGKDEPDNVQTEQTDIYQEAQPGDSQKKQTGLFDALLPPYLKGDTSDRDNVRNEQMDNSQEKLPDDSRDKPTGLMGSLLPPSNEDKTNEAYEVQYEQTDYTRDEQQDDEDATNEAYEVQYEQTDYTRDEQQDEFTDKKPGLVGSITSFLKGKRDGKADEQDEQVTDSQYKQTDDSRDKKSGVVGSITSYFKGKQDEQNNSQTDHPSLSGLSRLDGSQKVEWEDIHYPKGVSEFDQPTTSLDDKRTFASEEGEKEETGDQKYEAEFDQPAAFLDTGASESKNTTQPSLSENVPSDEYREDEGEETNDQMRETEYDQPAAFVDKGTSESKKDRPWLADKVQWDDDPSGEFRSTQQSKSEIEQTMTQNDQPDEYAVDKSAAFLIDQPLAFQIDDPVAFQVVGQPIALRSSDPDDFESRDQPRKSI